MVALTVRGALKRNQEAMNPEPLPGYVWLDTSRKVLHTQTPWLESETKCGSDRPPLDMRTSLGGPKSS